MFIGIVIILSIGVFVIKKETTFMNVIVTQCNELGDGFFNITYDFWGNKTVEDINCTAWNRNEVNMISDLT